MTVSFVRTIGALMGITMLFAPQLRAQTISSFTPAFGEPGTEVTIFGSGFDQFSVVSFGNIQASATLITSSQLRAIVPPDAVTAKIVIQQGLFPQSPTEFVVAPRVESFHRSGSVGVAQVAHGDQLQINGANFLFNNNQNIATVKIGSIEIAGISAPAHNLIFLTVPNDAITGPISVSTTAGTFVTTSNLVVSDTAIITSFIPLLGNGGTQVTISGGDFTSASSVTFNGVNALFHVTAADQIIATAPTNFGTGPIVVTTPTGMAASSTNFTDTGAVPLITGFTPESGRAGDPIVIHGANLSTVTNVSFNGTSATSFTPTSSTQIGVVVPVGVTSGPITVISPGGTNTSTNVFGVEPLITSFTPPAGEVGDQIVIEGENLREVNTVQFGGIAAIFTNTGPNQIHAFVPFGATNAPIAVLSPAGTNTTGTEFSVTFGEPLITGFTPENGLAGHNVIITGFNFFGATNVTVGDVPALFGVTADTQISMTVPASFGNGPITVFGPGGTNQSTNLFFFAPLLTDYSPHKASAGSLLTLNGTNLSGTTSVEFISTNQSKIPSPFTVIHDGQLQVTVPTNVAHGAITVTTPGGVILTTTNFTVLPRIDTFTPLWAPRGSQVTLTGQSFETISQVKVNGVQADYFPDSPTSIRLDIPVTATTGPISLLTTSGDTVSSATNLVVTFATDLTLTQTLFPPVAIQGTTFNVLISITNKGPSTATQVKVTQDFDTRFSIISATSTLGICSISGQRVTCDFASVTNGTSVEYTVQATADILGGSSISANVDALEDELSRFDNNHSVLMRVIQAGDDIISLTTIPGTNAVELRWKASAAAFQVQATTNLLNSGTQWQLLTNQIHLITNNIGAFFKVLTNEVNEQRKYYRLFQN